MRSIGGRVRINDEGRDIKAAVDLPGEAFRVTTVDLNGNKQVSDAGLVVFKDCKDLIYLDLYLTPVSDAGLAHFKDYKNPTRLLIGYTRVTDLSLIKDLPLKELDCDFRPERDADILRSIQTLEKINGKPAAEFWREVEKK